MAVIAADGRKTALNVWPVYGVYINMASLPSAFGDQTYECDFSADKRVTYAFTPTPTHSDSRAHTHKQLRIYIYIYICVCVGVCVCVCVYTRGGGENGRGGKRKDV